MAEKLYALVRGQIVENITSTLEEGVDLIQLEETLKQDWQFYSTSSNTLVPVLTLGGEDMHLQEGTDYSSLSYTLTSNTDITSVGEIVVKTEGNCTVSISSVNIVTPTQIDIVISITDASWLNGTPFFDLVAKEVTDSIGFTHKDIPLHISQK